MTTITVHKTAPQADSSFSQIDYTLPNDLPQTWSWSNIMSLMSTSISGEKGDYTWEYDTPTAILSISSKKSYQQRFYGKQADFNNLTRRMATSEVEIAALKATSEDEIAALKASLADIHDQLLKRDQADEYFSGVMKKVQIYTSLGRSLHNYWFRPGKLPQNVREGLLKAQLHNLPRCFMVWWFSWSALDPVQFSIPTVLSNLFPRYVATYVADAEDNRIRSALVDVHNKQTKVGNLVEAAWFKINDTDRLLMLLCWAARQEDRRIRNVFAHPAISRADATLIISDDFGLQAGRWAAGGRISDATRTNLLARALGLVPQNFI